MPCSHALATRATPLGPHRCSCTSCPVRTPAALQRISSLGNTIQRARSAAHHPIAAISPEACGRTHSPGQGPNTSRAACHASLDVVRWAAAADSTTVHGAGMRARGSGLHPAPSGAGAHERIGSANITGCCFFPGSGCSSSLPSNAGGASVWEVRSATQPQGRPQLPGLLVPGWGMIVIHIA